MFGATSAHVFANPVKRSRCTRPHFDENHATFVNRRSAKCSAANLPISGSSPQTVGGVFPDTCPEMFTTGMPASRSSPTNAVSFGASFFIITIAPSPRQPRGGCDGSPSNISVQARSRAMRAMPLRRACDAREVSTRTQFDFMRAAATRGKTGSRSGIHRQTNMQDPLFRSWLSPF